MRDSENRETIKILDFGLAKFLDGAALSKTAQAIGTPEYISPEQCSGRQVDARSDIYTLGCSMFDALTGRPPFQADGAYDFVIKHVSDTPPKLHEARPDLTFSSDMEDIVGKALSKRPDDRFQSATSLTLALQTADISKAAARRSARKSSLLTGKQVRVVVVGVLLAGLVTGLVLEFTKQPGPMSIGNPSIIRMSGKHRSGLSIADKCEELINTGHTEHLPPKQMIYRIIAEMEGPNVPPASRVMNERQLVRAYHALAMLEARDGDSDKSGELYKKAHRLYGEMISNLKIGEEQCKTSMVELGVK